MDKIKILEVVDNWYPIVDGVVKVVDNYAHILNLQQNVQCDVLCPWYPKTNDGKGGYKIIRSLSLSGGKFGVRLPIPMFDIKLHKYLNENHYDIIHAHSPVTLSRTILRYAKKNNIPVVFTVHTKYHEEINRSVHLKCLQQFALNFLLYSIRRMDYLWAVSDGMVKCLHETYKINKPCLTMRNGTEITGDFGDKALPLVDNLRKKYNINKEERVFLFVGRIVYVKNISLLIDTVKELISRGEKCKLLIVGDGDYKNKLIKQTEKLNLSNNVIFTGNISDKVELSAHYMLADLFLFASTFDSCGLVTKEAAALKLPTLFVKDSIAAEQIVDGHNGYVANLNNIEWADKIQKIFAEEEVYKQVQNNCNEIFRTWEDILQDVLQEYQKIVKLGKPQKNKS